MLDVSGRPLSSVLLRRLTTATLEQTVALQRLEEENNTPRSAARPFPAATSVNHVPQEVENQFLARRHPERFASFIEMFR